MSGYDSSKSKGQDKNVRSYQTILRKNCLGRNSIFLVAAHSRDIGAGEPRFKSDSVKHKGSSRSNRSETERTIKSGVKHNLGGHVCRR